MNFLSRRVAIFSIAASIFTVSAGGFYIASQRILPKEEKLLGAYAEPISSPTPISYVVISSDVEPTSLTLPPVKTPVSKAPISSPTSAPKIQLAQAASEDPVPTTTVTPVPTTAKNPPKACFSYYGDAVKDGVIYYQKNVTFDASCSENAVSYKWYANGTVLYGNYYIEEYKDSGKIITANKFTACYSCDKENEWHYSFQEKEYEYKLIVTGENGEESSITKLIQFKKE